MTVITIHCDRLFMVSEKKNCIYSTPHAKLIILCFFLFVRSFVCLLLGAWQKFLYLMEGTEQYKGTVSVWNCDTGRTVMPFQF